MTSDSSRALRHEQHVTMLPGRTESVQLRSVITSKPPTVMQKLIYSEVQMIPI